LRKRRIARGILLAGVVAAAVTYAWGTIEWRHAARDTEALQLKCEREVSEEARLRAECDAAGDHSAALKAYLEWAAAHPSFSARHCVIGVKTYPDGHQTIGNHWRYLETCSASSLWEDGDGKDVLLSQDQEKLRDMYKGRMDAWYGDGLWITCLLVLSPFGVPFLWYFALDRLRELSAAVQGKSA
jgi:hypothetical protein